MAQVLGPCTRMGDQEEAPGSWLQISITLAVVAIWGVNQWKEDLYLCLSLSLSITLSLSVSLTVYNSLSLSLSLTVYSAWQINK